MDAFGDEDEFQRAQSAFPALDDDLDGFTSIPAPPVRSTSASGALDFGFNPTPAPAVQITDDDEIGKFESQFPDIGGAPEPTLTFQPSAPAFSPSPAFGASASVPQQTTVFNAAISSPAFPEEEPQVIKDWREKQAAEINARDEAATSKRQEIIAQANQFIDDFYLEHKESVEHNIKQNKIREEEFKNSLSESLAAGTTWIRIADLIELENSQSKTIARTGPGSTDLTRFKEVLLRLKREGTSAPGAAGY